MNPPRGFSPPRGTRKPGAAPRFPENDLEARNRNTALKLAGVVLALFVLTFLAYMT